MQSTLTKIFIALILLFTLVGGILVWYIWHLQVPQTTTSTVQTSTNTGSSATTGSTASTKPAPVLPDIEGAYATLFQQLAAKQISFETVNGASTGAMAGVYKLYAKDVSQAKLVSPDVQDISIEVSLTDLNNDGTPEALVYENLPGYCGTGGCSFDVYTVVKDKWVKIFTAVSSQYIGVSTTYTNGYLDLYLSANGGDSTKAEVSRYQYDGKTYQLGPVVGVWNGKTFLNPRTK